MEAFELDVLIIVPTYNRAHLIEQTLNSISKQTYTNFKCIIIDDFSTDNTKRTIKNYSDKDRRFTYVKRFQSKNKGVCAARNYGLVLAKKLKPEFIFFSDDDDYLHPQLIEASRNKLHENNKLDFVHFKKFAYRNQIPTVHYYDLSKVQSYQKIDISYVSDILKGTLPLTACTVFWKASSLANQRFNEKLVYAEEPEFFTRILLNGLIGDIIDKVLYFNLKHLNSSTGKYSQRSKSHKLSLILSFDLIMKELVSRKKLTYDQAKYFVWTSISMKNPGVLNYIINTKSLKWSDNFKLILIFCFNRLLRLRLKIIKQYF